MTIIAGVAGDSPPRELVYLCSLMLSGAPPWLAAPAISCTDGAAFGRTLVLKTDTDCFDEGPVLSASKRYLLTGDVRLDNADDLIKSLDLPPPQAVSDVAVLAAIWERLGPETCRVAIGDYVAAVWDRQERELVLVRSISAVRPLLFVQRPGLLAFSTLPRSFDALPGQGSRLDMSALATILAGESYSDGRTALEGVRFIKAGTVVHLREGTNRVEDLWGSLLDEKPTESLEESAADLRSALTVAVEARLRRAGGTIASQLSAGRDSNAVTALAASINASPGEELIAVTGAPAAGFAGPVPGGRIGDESRLAALTAARYANVRHLICRSKSDLALADELDDAHRTHFGPLLNAASLGWWNATVDGARQAGATVLLTGVGGNNSISAGGGVHVHDLLRQDGLASGLRQVVRLAGSSPATRRNLLRIGLGAMLPPAVYHRLQRWRGEDHPSGWRLFREPLCSLLQETESKTSLDWAPPRNGYEYRRAALKFIEPAEPAFRHGGFTDLRDPTMDQRVLEASFRVPARWLVSRVDERPLYRAAFGDLLPRPVLENGVRGYQGADWYRSFSRHAVAAAMDRYRSNAAVQDLINLSAIDRLLADWPSGGWEQSGTIDLYRHELGLAVALASFLHVHFA